MASVNQHHKNHASITATVIIPTIATTTVKQKWSRNLNLTQFQTYAKLNYQPYFPNYSTNCQNDYRYYWIVQLMHYLVQLDLIKQKEIRLKKFQ